MFIKKKDSYAWPSMLAYVLKCLLVKEFSHSVA